MGYSYSQRAGQSMDAIEAACKETREGTGETSSNVYFANGRRYLFEVARRDQDDSGVAGTVHLAWDDANGSWARKVGTFRLDGEGNLVRGPALFKRAVAKWKGKLAQEVVSMVRGLTDSLDLARVVRQIAPPWKCGMRWDRKIRLWAVAFVRLVADLVPERWVGLLDDAVRVARTFEPMKRKFVPFNEWREFDREPVAAAILATTQTTARRMATATLTSAVYHAVMTGRVGMLTAHHMLWTAVGVNTPAPSFLPGWRDWNGRTVVRMAEAIERDGRYEDMPVLADALEDAGCDNPALLTACRGGPHFEGSHVLDLILRPDLACSVDTVDLPTGRLYFGLNNRVRTV